MKHFDLIGRVDVKPAIDALGVYHDLWDLVTFRQDHPASPHTQTQTIYLRMPSEFTIYSIFEDMHVIDYPTMTEPAFYDLVHKVAHLAYAEPARAMLVKLRAGGVIAPHIDEGAYADATDRYHCCLTTNDQCEMRIADEVVFAKPEEVWWFDKHAEHSVINAGDTSRIHLICDCWRD